MDEVKAREATNLKTGEVLLCVISEEEAIRVLKEKFKEKPSDFIKGLITAYEKYGRLSTAQWFWVYKIAQKDDKKEEKSVELALGFTEQLTDSFTASKLQYPALHFDKCKIYIYGGQLRVKHDEMRYGYIENDLFYPTNASDELIEFIVELSNDPFGFAADEGKKKGICCFCKRELTNGESVQRGYGPVCADRYDLPHDHPKQHPLSSGPENLELEL